MQEEYQTQANQIVQRPGELNAEAAVHSSLRKDVGQGDGSGPAVGVEGLGGRAGARPSLPQSRELTGEEAAADR